MSDTGRCPFARAALVVALLAIAPLLPAACGGAPKADFPDVELSAYQGADVLGGEEPQLSGLLSQGKPIVVNFWAGLCPPCRAEMPDFQRVADEQGDEVLIVGVDVGPFLFLGSRDDGKALLRELGITYPAATTFDSTVVQRFQITGLPTTIFISPKGQITRKWSGLLTYEKIVEFIEDAKAS